MTWPYGIFKLSKKLFGQKYAHQFTLMPNLDVLVLDTAKQQAIQQCTTMTGSNNRHCIKGTKERWKEARDFCIRLHTCTNTSVCIENTRYYTILYNMNIFNTYKHVLFVLFNPGGKIIIAFSIYLHLPTYIYLAKYVLFVLFNLRRMIIIAFLFTYIYLLCR